MGKTTLSARQLSKRTGALRCRVEGDRVFLSGRAIPYLEKTIEVDLPQEQTLAPIQETHDSRLSFTHEELEFQTDPSRMDLEFIAHELSQTYWGANRRPKKLEPILKNCFTIGMFRGSEQIAFGRVVTDFETHAYIMDVIVKKSERGKGYGMRMMKAILEHPAFENVEAMTLKTKDAGEFYGRLGFQSKQINQYEINTKCMVEAPQKRERGLAG